MARIDHTTCSHLPTARDRATCRANRALNLTVSTPEPVAVAEPKIRFSRINAVLLEITVDGTRVGTINKEERFEQVMIPNSRLAYAAQKRLVRYHVRLDTGAFPGSTYDQRNDKIGYARQADAKAEAVRMIKHLAK